MAWTYLRNGFVELPALLKWPAASTDSLRLTTKYVEITTALNKDQTYNWSFWMPLSQNHHSQSFNKIQTHLSGHLQPPFDGFLLTPAASIAQPCLPPLCLPQCLHDAVCSMMQYAYWCSMMKQYCISASDTSDLSYQCSEKGRHMKDSKSCSSMTEGLCCYS